MVTSSAALSAIPPASAPARVVTSSPAILGPATAIAAIASVGAGLLAGQLVITAGVILIVLGLLVMQLARAALRSHSGVLLERRQRDARRRERLDRLDEVGISRDALVELTALGDDIARRDPSLHRRFEIEELLDRHVELTLAHERFLRALRMADRDQLVRARLAHLDRAGGGRRAALCGRRLETWDRCKADADRCDEELAIIGDLIRLLAQRAASPSELLDDDGVERRLAQLDEEELALRQLQAAEPS